MRNFHLPLPEGTYAELQAAAEQARLPATAIARAAISDWLRVTKRAARRKAVLEYAAEMAGTVFDMDAELETAAADHLRRSARRSK